MNNQINITLVLTQEHLSALNEAISLAPYGRIAPVVSEINRQISLQMTSPQPPSGDQ